jgi:hypothetical protein
MILRLISKAAGQCHRNHPDAEGMNVRSGNGRVMNAANDEKGQGSEPASDAAESGNSETVERQKDQISIDCTFQSELHFLRAFYLSVPELLNYTALILKISPSRSSWRKSTPVERGGCQQETSYARRSLWHRQLLSGPPLLSSDGGIVFGRAI